MSEYIYPIISSEDQLPIYLIGIDHSNNMISVLNPKGFPYYQFIFCTKGKITFSCKGHKTLLKKGDWLYIPRYITYGLENPQPFSQSTTIMFSGQDIDNLMSNFDLTKPLIINIYNDNTPLNIVNSLTDNILSNCYLNGYANSSLLYNLIVTMSLHNKNMLAEDEKSKNNAISPVLQYINNNYSKDITLEELSVLLSVSPQYLCKLFKICLNCRPFEYISKVRIQHSKALLSFSNKSISEISEAVGFKDCSYFCAVFKRHLNVTPAEFRNNYNYIIN